MNDRLREITEEINLLTTDILVPARTSKSKNDEAFTKLYVLLDEVKHIVKGTDMINRELAGLLFFIYTSISAEAKHVDYTNPLFIEAGRLEDYVNKILWDSPFGR
ncbi:MAG: hypothetical protein PHD60_11090 [Clostridia bacterium]|nr:hypothetical protein [Clostridia bacterium]